MKKSITSREILPETGVSFEKYSDFPLCYRHLLITSVITFMSAKKLRKALNNRGHSVSLRDVLKWQHAMREWLGLPEIGQGKPSIDFRYEVKMWLQHEGNPTIEEIDAGWIPSHKREKNAVSLQNLSPEHKKIMEEFRVQAAALNAAKDDDEVIFLMETYQKAEQNRTR